MKQAFYSVFFCMSSSCVCVFGVLRTVLGLFVVPLSTSLPILLVRWCVTASVIKSLSLAKVAHEAQENLAGVDGKDNKRFTAAPLQHSPHLVKSPKRCNSPSTLVVARRAKTKTSTG